VDSLAIGTLALNLTLGLMILLFVFRIILSWYPQFSLDKFPFKLIAIPTEPLLVLFRKLVPPIGGVDITPVIWVGIFSLMREMLLGQQGILTMMRSLN
jgi:YggT family protein